MPDLGNTTVFSQTDASNATGTMPSWSGTALPSTIDDAGRALQGAVFREWNWRNPTITSGGSANTQTLTYSVAPAALYNGQVYNFIAGYTNTGAVTLNVNSLGATAIKKIVGGSAVALGPGDIAVGQIITVSYNTAASAFLLATNSLTGAVMPFAGSTEPVGWIFAYGQAISRTTYAALYAVLGTTYGTGDGSTTFNIPDLRGRVAAGRDDMGGSAASRLTSTRSVAISSVSRTSNVVTVTTSTVHGLTASDSVTLAGVTNTGFNGTFTVASVTSTTVFTFSQTAANASSSGGTVSVSITNGVNGASLGATGGSSLHSLTVAEMPSHTHDVPIVVTSNNAADGGTSRAQTGTTTSTSTGGGGPHNNVQPTFILNYIIKT